MISIITFICSLGTIIRIRTYNRNGLNEQICLLPFSQYNYKQKPREYQDDKRTPTISLKGFRLIGH